jgi:hypothetical protein
MSPGALATNNLFIVRSDGSVEHLADAGALEAFFRVALPRVTIDDEARDAAKAWLRLAQEFRQDGFLQFSIPDDSLKVASIGDGGAR